MVERAVAGKIGAGLSTLSVDCHRGDADPEGRAPRIAELRRCLDPKLRGLEVALQRQVQGEIGPGRAAGRRRPDAELGREAERLMVDQGKRLIERAIDRGLDDDVGGVAALDADPGDHDQPSFSRMAPTCPPVTAKSMRRAVNVALPATPVSGGIVSK